MQDSTTKTAAGGRLPTFGPDTIETLMRARVRTTIEAIVQEELDAALGAAKSARVGETRQGYRHGSRERTLTTSLGPATIPMPRARMQAADGTTAEWRSATVTRYQRRTVRVDEMILGVYVAGTNTRRITGALAPLLRNGSLSKDAVSRLVGRLGVVARIVTGPHDANRQDHPHLPMRYDTGRPRAVIRFNISQPRTTSLPCPAGLRARRPSPMMDSYRKNVFSTRP